MVWPSIAYYHTFDGVIANYTAGALANNAILIPVGTLWKKYIEATGDYSYYSSDGFHPSLAGSKFAAEIIVETLFTQSSCT
jgi:lysophospholipase L1-like esterase